MLALLATRSIISPYIVKGNSPENKERKFPTGNPPLKNGKKFPTGVVIIYN